MRHLVRGRTRAASLLLIVTLTSASACLPEGSGLPRAWRGYDSPTYREDASWLCRGDRPGDLCTDADLDATIVQADGTASIEHHEVAADPPVDCFYVYPTVSGDPVPNSDMIPGPEEIATVLGQAAPFTSTCRVFAPMYRQVPFTAAITPGFTPEQAEAALEVAYQDVLDSFKHYMANDNHGRPFVLYGHSQGGILLARLIHEEIESRPALRRHLLSALLIGTANLTVPVGETVGGTFDRMRLCTANGQTGCLVAFSSYLASDPPGPGSLFGRTTEPGMQVPCVNPAALGGGSGVLRPYWWMGSFFGPLGPYADPAQNATVTTPRFSAPDLVSAACAYTDGASYLAITVNADPTDPRLDDIRGEFTLFPSFGLHVVDIDLTLGTLIDVVTTQSTTYCHRHHCHT